ncbi:MAG: hypothetical protein Q8M17_04250 [Actinomycetota bacterium]|nr:hypothetical protein [Actinomycetota bacterium]
MSRADRPDAADDRIITAANRTGRRVPDLVVRGLSEREILAHAPAMTCDRIHWDTVDAFDPRPLADALGMPAWTRRWSDGQHRVWVPEGRGHEAREVIRAWCEQRDVEAVNIRVESRVPFRDLALIPEGLLGELLGAAVEWLWPRMIQVRRRIVIDLDLVDDEDVKSMMYLFLSDHVDRFDADREGRNGTLNLLAFFIGKLRTWPQDAARTAYGRNLVSDRVAIGRALDAVSAGEGRWATEGEVAGSLGISVTDLRRRELAIATLSSLRNYHQLVVEATEESMGAIQVAASDDVEDAATTHARAAALTRAVLAAVNDPTATGRRAQDPLALAAVYLTFWEGLTRPAVARELDILPKTASAAVSRVLSAVQDQDLL